MNKDCIFCKIVNNEIPSERIYEDEEIMAFKDIQPKAPVHVLIIPKKHFDSASDFKDKYKMELDSETEEELTLAGRMLAVCARLAESYHLNEGYRVVTNVGEYGGQTVYHLHFHLLGDNYGLQVNDLKLIDSHFGTKIFLMETSTGKYIIKTIPLNGGSIEKEGYITEFLYNNGISVARLLKTKNNMYHVETNEYKFHIQEFIEGETLKVNTAPDWFLKKSALVLGKINCVLSKYDELDINFGKDFFTESNANEERIKHLKRISAFNIDTDKLTYSNSHGDYHIGQIITRNEELTVIDWTSACKLPLCLEVIMSYTTADPECKNGKIDCNRRKNASAGKNASLALSFLVIGIGFGVFGVYEQTICCPLYELENKTCEVNGVVVSRSDPNNDMSGYIIETKIDGVTARFSLYGSDTDAEYGDSVNFTAYFTLFNDNAVFSEESYYSSKGILLKATAKSTITVEKVKFKNLAYYIYEFNSYIKDRILTQIPDDTGGLLCALFLGDKSQLSSQLSDNIKRSGVSHYTAVSGLHLTIISHVFMLLLGLTPLHGRKKLKFAFLALIILTFMFFFKLTPSVTRSGIMLLIYYGGNLFLRRGSTLNSLGFALLLILLVSPYACRDSGLLLSMAGTFGIGVVAPAVNGKFKSTCLKTLREALISTVCAVYCTLPFTAIFFKALIATLIFTIFGGFFAFPLFIAAIMSRLMNGIINFFGELKYSYIPLDYDFMLFWIITAFVFIIAVYLIFNIGQTIKAGIITVFTLVGMILLNNYFTLDDIVLNIYSDGGAGVVVLRNRSDCVIVVSDDSKNAASYIESFLKDNFLDKATILCLLGSTKNATGFFETISSDIYIKPDSTDYPIYDISGKFKLYTGDGGAIVEYKGYLIEIADIKKAADGDYINNVKTDMLVLYGYKLNKPKINTIDNIVYISKRMIKDKDNEVNAYFEKVKYVLK
ncbi:histidine triad hit protein [Holotrichia oblita]|nr:histidine triad hit protein [Holotrichia oblita]